MFKRIAPQRAQHSSGYIVQVGGRYLIQYLEGEVVAEVETDMLSRIVPIYYETLVLHPAVSAAVAPSESQSDVILSRIKAGLDCLGLKYELREGRS